MDKKFDLRNQVEYSTQASETKPQNPVFSKNISKSFLNILQFCANHGGKKLKRCAPISYYDPSQSTKTPRQRPQPIQIPCPIHFVYGLFFSTQFLFARDHDLYLIHDRHFGIQLLAIVITLGKMKEFPGAPGLMLLNISPSGH